MEADTRAMTTPRSAPPSGDVPPDTNLTGARQNRGTGGMSAKERRESVIRAAITEFELKGYYGTTTAAMAGQP